MQGCGGAGRGAGGGVWGAGRGVGVQGMLEASDSSSPTAAHRPATHSSPSRDKVLCRFGVPWWEGEFGSRRSPSFSRVDERRDSGPPTHHQVGTLGHPRGSWGRALAMGGGPVGCCSWRPEPQFPLPTAGRGQGDGAGMSGGATVSDAQAGCQLQPGQLSTIVPDLCAKP